MIFFIICVLGEGGGHHYKIYIFFFYKMKYFYNSAVGQLSPED